MVDSRPTESLQTGAPSHRMELSQSVAASVSFLEEALRDSGVVVNRRKWAAQLIDEVLEERMEPRQAINRWPILPAEWVDEQDRSLATAFAILWHFEADEDQQQGQIYYIDAQLALLELVAKHFSHGEPLPHYILESYCPQNYRVAFYSEDLAKWGALRTLKGRLKQYGQLVVAIWKQGGEFFQPGK